MNKKIALLAYFSLLVCGCSEKDPILPGERTAIFENETLDIINQEISGLPENLMPLDTIDCKYTQDASNIVWDGDRKIFSGFPTNNSVKSSQKPVCSGKYVYAGLTTGELVKINPKNKQILWIADIYRASNMTGGASILDIIAPIIIQGNSVYVGGLGDAFCRINASSGNKTWCLPISVAVPFITTENVSFVVSTDNYLYAIRNSDGAVYWRTEIKKQSEPVYKNKTIIVGKQKINAASGNLEK